MRTLSPPGYTPPVTKHTNPAQPGNLCPISYRLLSGWISHTNFCPLISSRHFHPLYHTMPDNSTISTRHIKIIKVSEIINYIFPKNFFFQNPLASSSKIFESCRNSFKRTEKDEENVVRNASSIEHWGKKTPKKWVTDATMGLIRFSRHHMYIGMYVNSFKSYMHPHYHWQEERPLIRIKGRSVGRRCQELVVVCSC